MLMGIIWTGMILVSILYSCAVGTAAAVGDAAIKGAEEAVRLCLNIGGIMCLWCAVMELMRECKIAEALAGTLKPILRLLFPEGAKHESILEPLSANVGANLLGLGNAATPMGIQAAKGMAALGKKGEATNELCRLVVLNTASIQLLPTTVAARKCHAQLVFQRVDGMADAGPGKAQCLRRLGKAATGGNLQKYLVLGNIHGAPRFYGHCTIQVVMYSRTNMRFTNVASPAMIEAWLARILPLLFPFP